MKKVVIISVVILGCIISSANASSYCQAVKEAAKTTMNARQQGISKNVMDTLVLESKNLAIKEKALVLEINATAYEISKVDDKEIQEITVNFFGDIWYNECTRRQGE